MGVWFGLTLISFASFSKLPCSIPKVYYLPWLNCIIIKTCTQITQTLTMQLTILQISVDLDTGGLLIEIKTGEENNQRALKKT